MGIVYKARQRSIGRHVALKLLVFGPLAGPEVVKRFRMEATSAGALQHPHIVAIHEVGIYQDQHYLVMDYVPGPNLAALIANQPWPALKAATLVKTLGETTQYAHEHGILHRDLKPSNILIDEHDQPKITDFGLAKRLVGTDSTLSLTSPNLSRDAVESVLTESLTLTGQVLGSPNYMPPEQAGARRGRVGAWSDVYSLGAILYHLLTGRPPSLGETITATLHQVLETDAASPRLLNPRVPADLETICLKCLEKEPKQRYATARDLADELRRFLKGEPILARPINRMQRLGRWCRRNPVVASLASATLVLLLTVAIGSPIAAFRIDRERQRALRSETDARGQLYAARIHSAQQAWEQSHLIRLTQLLEETRASPDRGFEWAFWRKQVHRTFGTLRGHLGRINSVAYSPDGQRIVSGSDDHTAIVWATPTRQEVALLKGHRAPVTGVSWFPDSRRIVTGSHDHSVKIWDAADGRELASARSRRGRIESVAVSPDGQSIASANQDGTASVWSFHSSTYSSIPPSLAENLLNRPGGTRVPPGGEGRGEGFPLREIITLEGHTDAVLSIEFSSDGQRIATASADGTARVWDPKTGGSLQILKGHRDYVRSVAFSPDGTRILTASDDETAKIWETSSGRLLLTLRGHNDWVRSARFSPDGAFVATASDDGSAKLWNTTDGRELTTARLHDVPIYCAGFSPDGQRLITGGRDNVARIWKLGSNLDPVTFRGHQATVRSVAFSRDGRLMVTSGEDGTARTWDVTSEREPRVFNPNDRRATTATFSPDGRTIVTATMGGQPARVWDVSSGQELVRLPEHGTAVWAAAFSPDGRRIVTGSYQGSVKVAEAATGREILSLKGTPDAVTAAAYSPDGRRIAVASFDQTASLWDAESGRQLLVLRGHSDIVWSVTFTLDGRQIVTGSADRQAKVWDADTGRELLTFRGHGGNVNSVAVSPDGRRIVTASGDGTARVWHAANGGQLLSLRSESGQPLFGAAFSPDGLRVAAVGADGLVSVWDAAASAQVSSWEQEEQSALARVAQRERERTEAMRQTRAAQARDPGTIRQWLVLLPIPLSEHRGANALDIELCPGESRLRPRSGDRIRLGESELTWRLFQLGHHVIDFISVQGHSFEWNVGVGYVAYSDNRLFRFIAAQTWGTSNSKPCKTSSPDSRAGFSSNTGGSPGRYTWTCLRGASRSQPRRAPFCMYSSIFCITTLSGSEGEHSSSTKSGQSGRNFSHSSSLSPSRRSLRTQETSGARVAPLGNL